MSLDVTHLHPEIARTAHHYALVRKVFLRLSSVHAAVPVQAHADTLGVESSVHYGVGGREGIDGVVDALEESYRVVDGTLDFQTEVDYARRSLVDAQVLDGGV